MESLAKPNRQEAIDQVRRLLASDYFSNSKMQAKLLRFLVRQSFAGKKIVQADLLVELYGPSTVDSNNAKSTANLVRRKIRKYYANEGRDDLVRVELIPGPGYKIAFSYSGSAKSVRDYRLGLRYQQDFSVASLETAYRCFQGSWRNNPKSVMVMATWSETALILSLAEELFSVGPEMRIIRPQAIHLALKALSIDGKNWRALVVLASASLFNYNRQGAKDLFDEAIECNSTEVKASLWYALFLVTTGDAASGLSIVDTHLDRHPTSNGLGAVGAFLYYLTRNFSPIERLDSVTGYSLGYRSDIAKLLNGLIDMAISDSGVHHILEISRKTLDLDPSNELIRPSMKTVEERHGPPGLDPRFLILDRFSGLIVMGYMRRDMNDYAVKEMAYILARKTVKIKPMQMAIAYMAMGNKARALAYLRRAFYMGDVVMNWVHMLPLFDSLREHPRFQQIVATITNSDWECRFIYPEDKPFLERKNRRKGTQWFTERDERFRL